MNTNKKEEFNKRNSSTSSPRRRSVEVTAFGWFIIIQGILISIIISVSMGFILVAPLLILIFSLYIGVGFLSLKKRALRQIILLAIFGILVGAVIAIEEGLQAKILGITVFLLCSALLYFLTRPKVREQFRIEQEVKKKGILKRSVKAPLLILKIILVIFLMGVIPLGYDVYQLAKETEKVRNSFKVGSPIYEFYLPENGWVFIDFSNFSKEEECFSASLFRGSRLFIKDEAGEYKDITPASAESLKAQIKENVSRIDKCSELAFTMHASLCPLKSSFKVNYSGVTVSSVGKKRLWD